MMLFRRAKRKLFATVAVLVVVVVSLAPVWSALTGGLLSPASWVEICSAEGAKRVAVDLNGSPVSPDKSTHETSGAHCPFCNLHQAPATLSPAPACVLPLTPPLADFPDRFYTAARPVHAWAPARARAPPAPS